MLFRSTFRADTNLALTGKDGTDLQFVDRSACCVAYALFHNTGSTLRCDHVVRLNKDFSVFILNCLTGESSCDTLLKALNLFISIVGQQISTKAHETIWQRIQSSLGEITPQRVISLTDEELQRFGISFKKVTYIKRAATKILNGEFDIHGLYDKTDEEVIECLSKLDGIGIWSAEMLMLFSMQRPDILSYSDLAIQRGLRIVYHHRDITRKLFEKYRRRYSPYSSVASLYLWAVAGGAIEGMKDYATTKKKRS